VAAVAPLAPAPDVLLSDHEGGRRFTAISDASIAAAWSANCATIASRFRFCLGQQLGRQAVTGNALRAPGFSIPLFSIQTLPGA